MKTTTFKTVSIITLLLITLTVFNACKKDDPKPENPEELITTVKLLFTDSANAGNTATATFADPDGAGGNNPTTFDTIRLQANKTYYTQILLLDESKSPVDTISNEVEEENDEHLFNFSSTAGITIAITDFDVNALPVGLSSKWKTGAAANGNTTVILKHQPGIKTGDPALGETDVEVVFPTRVQ